jgi:hypothetical protein
MLNSDYPLLINEKAFHVRKMHRYLINQLIAFPLLYHFINNQNLVFLLRELLRKKVLKTQTYKKRKLKRKGG